MYLSKGYLKKKIYLVILSYSRQCRVYQQAVDECFKTKIGVLRPEVGYFSKMRLHETSRPKPEVAVTGVPERLPAIEAGNREPRTKNYGPTGFDL